MYWEPLLHTYINIKRVNRFKILKNVMLIPYLDGLIGWLALKTRDIVYVPNTPQPKCNLNLFRLAPGARISCSRQALISMSVHLKDLSVEKTRRFEQYLLVLKTSRQDFPFSITSVIVLY